MAVAALAIPVCAGLGYLLPFGAPRTFPLINTGALVVAVLWIALAPSRFSPIVRHVLMAVTLVLLFVPLLTGPSIDSVARWLPLGPFQLHAGMLVVPALAVLAGKETDNAPIWLSLALLAALLQPDMATGAALMLAAVGLYDATRDWKFGVFAIVAFVASIVAAIHGELPAQPFVERIIFVVARTDIVAALVLVAALVASFYLIVSGPAGGEPSRKALAGSLVGFSFAGMVSNYPSALIGYGAAPILGFGLALGLLGMTPGVVDATNRRQSADK